MPVLPAATSRPPFMDRPRVAIVGTGGTIAGSAAATHDQAYLAGVTPVGELLTGLIAAVPALERIADLSSRDVLNLDSVDLTSADRLRIAHTVTRLLDPQDTDPQDGVVVTHGTDTLEETAVLLHLGIRSAAPVVLVGAMRPADVPGADGPANLLDAVTVAADPSSRGRGPLVVMDGQILAARDVAKETAGGSWRFGSPAGALGVVSGGRIYWRRELAAPHAHRSLVDIRAIRSLPRVAALPAHPDLTPEMCAAFVAAASAAGVRGLVFAGPGSGSLPGRLRDSVRAAVAGGLVVVRASRVTGGTARRQGALDDDTWHTVAGGDFDAAKARVVLAVALSQSADPAHVQDFFDRA